jgi:hypothetical protein
LKFISVFEELLIKSDSSSLNYKTRIQYSGALFLLVEVTGMSQGIDRYKNISWDSLTDSQKKFLGYSTIFDFYQKKRFSKLIKG